VKLAERGEFGIIAELKQRCAGSPELLTGIGDDCAVIVPPPGERLLVTSDLLAEGIHFRRDWTDLRSLGRKCASVNLSDLAAMGATPRFLFLALSLPADLDTDGLDAFFAGFLSACSDHGAVLAGGDTCASAAGLTVSVTALGSAPPDHVVLRGGAIPGDGLYVSGTLGDSSLALQQLFAGQAPDPFLRQRHLDPTPRVALGRALGRSGLASAMIDLSDGLLADLGHLLAASGVGARIDTDRLPLSPPFSSGIATLPGLADLALTGGEDYELLFSAPATAEATLQALAEEARTPVTRIGRILPGTDGLQLFSADQPRPLPEKPGYKHFADA